MKRLASIRRLTQVLNAVANGITVQDPSGELLFVNEAAARMLGCSSPAEALSLGGAKLLSKYQFFNESGQRLTAQDLPGRRALTGIAEPEMTIRYQPKAAAGSEQRWASIKALPVTGQDGAVVLSVNVIQDITAQKKVEQELKEANVRITKLLEQTLVSNPEICPQAGVYPPMDTSRLTGDSSTREKRG